MARPGVPRRARVVPRGYRLKDARHPTRLGIRRIRGTATRPTSSARPSLALPSRTGRADAAEGPLFLRALGVPFRALARVPGRGPVYWHRVEVAPGRSGVVGTTPRKARLPEHVPADEHHPPRGGVSDYAATTAGEGRGLGAALARSAAAGDPTAAYGVFDREARDVRKDYHPRTLDTDGRVATRRAWAARFPVVAIPRCFPHRWRAIRRRGELADGFAGLSGWVWHAYHAPTRSSFGRRRRLWGWARAHVGVTWVLGWVEEWCGRSAECGVAYADPGGHPAVARANGGWRNPAGRANRHRDHGDWLHNLLVAASLAGLRK